MVIIEPSKSKTWKFSCQSKIPFRKSKGPLPGASFQPGDALPCPVQPGRLCEGWQRAGQRNVALPYPSCPGWFQWPCDQPSTLGSSYHREEEGEYQSQEAGVQTSLYSASLDDLLQLTWPLCACFLLQSEDSNNNLHHEVIPRIE